MSHQDRFSDVYSSLRMARESRDGFPSEHLSELITIVGAICDQMGLAPRNRREALQVAELHDIGLLGVSSELLASDEPLDELQREQIAEYPIVAARLVEDMPGMEHIADAIRHLREHWDGSGTPNGLEGDEIPLSSRIVFVSSAYVAMSLPRPHRAAMHPRVVCDELERGAGSSYDPQIVGVLLELVKPALQAEA